MEIILKIIFFVFGLIMGSFFHVVATRVSNNESIIKPGSHCHKCNHKLKWYELIPIVSFLIQNGKSRCCGQKLPISYIIVEVATASLFAVAFDAYGLSIELLINLIFISALVIVIVSDIEYMIILDEVLYIASLLIIVIYFIFFGFESAILHLCSAAGAFITMYVIKLIGDFLFKKESLGGGDIKLMFLFGLVIGYPLAIISIFLGTFLAFPIALYVLFSRKDNMIPFGPFLSMSAIIILISGIKFGEIIKFLID